MFEWLIRISTASDSYIVSIFPRPDRRNVATSLKTNLFIIASSSAIFRRKMERKSYRFTLSVGFSCYRICNRCGRRWRSFQRTCQTVVFDTLNSLMARRRFVQTTHKRLSNDFNTLSTHRQSAGAFALHTQPPVTKRLYQAPTDGWLKGLFPYSRHNITTDFVSWNANTENAFSGPDAILLYWRTQLCLAGRMHSWL
jgi:hypothetical protein